MVTCPMCGGTGHVPDWRAELSALRELRKEAGLVAREVEWKLGWRSGAVTYLERSVKIPPDVGAKINECLRAIAELSVQRPKGDVCPRPKPLGKWFTRFLGAGPELRRDRLAAWVKLVEIARQLNRSPGFVSRVEHGKIGKYLLSGPFVVEWRAAIKACRGGAGVAARPAKGRGGCQDLMVASLMWKRGTVTCSSNGPRQGARSCKRGEKHQENGFQECASG
jgi:hypothetical protein